MADLSAFPITKRWPAKHPDRIQLYSLPTPNGVKASAMVEESGLPYEPHLVDITEGDQTTPEFLSLNPNNKIPAILDPDGPGGAMALWESGAILLHLAEKSGKLLPPSGPERWEAIQWLMWQMGGAGPMFGQFGHFYKFARDKTGDDEYPLERYTAEARRLLGVLENRVDGREFILDWGYSVADVAIWPWARVLGGFYEASEQLGLDDFPKVGEWLDRCLAREASQKALNIPSRD